jgi:DNA-binding transcriptional regulator YiaG
VQPPWIIDGRRDEALAIGKHRDVSAETKAGNGAGRASPEGHFPMTPEAYREILEELRLSNGQAAKLLGVTPRTSNRWLAGTRDIPAPAYRLLVLLRDYRLSPKDASRHLAEVMRDFEGA